MTYSNNLTNNDHEKEHNTDNTSKRSASSFNVTLCLPMCNG